MAESKEQVTNNIKGYMAKWGGNYSDWYVGISKDAKKRLFTDHKVKEDGDAWIYDTVESSDIAREIEAHFCNTLGTDGDSGGGDDESDMVYAYKKNNHTKER